MTFSGDPGRRRDPPPGVKGDQDFYDFKEQIISLILPEQACKIGFVGAGKFSFCEDLIVNIHPEDREGVRQFMDPERYLSELKKKVYVSHACRIRHCNSRYYWSELTFCNSLAEDSTAGGEFLFLIRDIHERKIRELREEAEQRAALKDLQNKYDQLFEENMKDEQTGCYNRKGMRYFTDIVLEEVRKTGKYLFTCVADLNGLKHLNDTYGHAAGDEAIAAVSAEL